MSLKGVLRKFQWCSKQVFRVLQGSLKGGSRKSQGWFNGVKGGLRVFKRSSMSV